MNFREAQGTFREIETFCISVMVVVTQLYTLAKTHHILHLKLVNVTKLNLNKVWFLKIQAVFFTCEATSEIGLWSAVEEGPHDTKVGKMRQIRIYSWCWGVSPLPTDGGRMGAWWSEMRVVTRNLKVWT